MDLCPYNPNWTINKTPNWTQIWRVRALEFTLNQSQVLVTNFLPSFGFLTHGSSLVWDPKIFFWLLGCSSPKPNSTTRISPQKFQLFLSYFSSSHPRPLDPKVTQKFSNFFLVLPSSNPNSPKQKPSRNFCFSTLFLSLLAAAKSRKKMARTSLSFLIKMNRTHAYL